MKEKHKQIKKAGTLGIIGNIFLAIIKGIIGFLTKSQAMIADAYNSFGDVASSLMTLIGNKIASKPRDKDHHMGHGKNEYFFSLFISLLMLYFSGSTLLSSIKSIWNPSYTEFSIYLVIVCIITILTKLSLFLYTNAIAKKYKNILIKANALDHMSDCFVTIGTLISVIFSYFHIYLVDAIVGILISLWIMRNGIKIFLESYDVLTDKCMDKSIEDKVRAIIKTHPEVQKVTHFNSTPVGYQYQISFTIFVDGNLSTYASHKIADTIEDEIEASVEEIYLSVIHVNPI